MTTSAMQLLDAILPHVAFDGWSDEAFAAARDDCGLTPEEAHAVCPRGAVDLAIWLMRLWLLLVNCRLTARAV